jgi:uncharacterized membrane protein YeaQ/YmgE (transglycosylase-associated protein family)
VLGDPGVVIVWLVVGVVAGSLASHTGQVHGYRLVGAVILGAFAAFLGGLLVRQTGFDGADGFMGAIAAFAAAATVVFLLQFMTPSPTRPRER